MTDLPTYLKSLTLEDWVALFGTRENPENRERVPFQPWSGQEAFLKWLENQREAWCPKARQLGLSEIAAERLVKGMLQIPRSQYVVISKTEDDAIYFLAERVLQKLENLPIIPGLQWPTVEKKSQTKITLSNGSVIWSLPAANASGASRTLNGFVVDEAGGIDKQPNCKFSVLYKNLLPTIEKSKGWGMVIGTSEPGSFFNQQLYKQWEGTAAAMYYFLSWRTDPSRDEAWRVSQISKYDTESDFYNQYPENMAQFFATKEGRIFRTFDTTVNGTHIREFEPNFNLELYTGYDHGFRHFAASLFALYDVDKDYLYYFDELFWKGIDIDEIARDYRERLSLMGRVPKAQIADTAIFNSDARRSVADHFRDYGVTWSKAWKFDEAASRNMLSSRFTNAKVIIHPRMRNTITQLSNYVWSPSAKGERPVDKDDEAPDIMRYIEAHLSKGGAPQQEKAKEERREYSSSRSEAILGRSLAKSWQTM